MHGPRRGGFCACEIVANAYRSRRPLSFSRQPRRSLPFAFAVFLCARPSFSTPYACEAMKSEGERNKGRRGSETIFSSFSPPFSIFPFTGIDIVFFIFIIQFILCDRFACDYVHFRAI